MHFSSKNLSCDKEFHRLIIPSKKVFSPSDLAGGQRSGNGGGGESTRLCVSLPSDQMQQIAQSEGLTWLTEGYCKKPDAASLGWQSSTPHSNYASPKSVQPSFAAYNKGRLQVGGFYFHFYLNP